MENEKATIVIDNGSSMCRAGFSGEDSPQFVFPTCVGLLRDQRLTSSMKHKECFVGKEALATRRQLSIKRPIERGIIKKMEDMEKIWEDIFCKLQVDPKEHPVLLTAPPNPSAREQMAKIMFEKFQVPAIRLFLEPVLSLYSARRITGFSMVSGDGLSSCASVYEGDPLYHSVISLDLAGKDLTEHLMNMLNEKGRISHLVGQNTVRDIKEMFCHVALDFNAENLRYTNDASLQKKYDLPDGHKITVGNESVRCPEVLFQPSLIGSLSEGIHKAIYQSIMKSDMDLQKDLYQNIVLSGGSSMFPGFTERMEKELTALAPRNTEIKMTRPADCKNSVWIGGSLRASLPNFLHDCITKQRYEELGSIVVRQWL